MTCTSCLGSWEWKADEDETWVEKCAFFYPRLIKYVATSSEAYNDGIGTQAMAGSIAALVGFPIGLPLTLILGVPAIIIYGGRSAKRQIDYLVEDFKESRQGRENKPDDDRSMT